MVLGVMFILFSGVTVMRNTYLSRAAEKASSEALEAVDEYMDENAQPAEETTAAFADTATQNIGDNAGDADGGHGETEVVTVNTVQYFSVLSIPTLGLRLPVSLNFSYENLRYAPCRYQGSVDNNDIIIIAHNYSSHFGRISSLSAGDRVSLMLLDGTVYAYEVDEITRYDGKDLDGMNGGEWDMTLFTCDYSGNYRDTVRLVRLQ